MKTVDFSETIVACDLKTTNLINEGIWVFKVKVIS